MVSKDEIIDILIGIISGGRGQGAVDPGLNPFFDRPSLIEAIEEDRRRQLSRLGTIGEMLESRATPGQPFRLPDFTQSPRRSSSKKKRKVSKYQREFGRQLKKLKKAHPRTPVQRLMKRAHRATKKAMK